MLVFLSSFLAPLLIFSFPTLLAKFYFLYYYYNYYWQLLYYYCEHACTLREQLVAAYESLTGSMATLKESNVEGNDIQMLLDKVSIIHH